MLARRDRNLWTALTGDLEAAVAIGRDLKDARLGFGALAQRENTRDNCNPQKHTANIGRVCHKLRESNLISYWVM